MRLLNHISNEKFKNEIICVVVNYQYGCSHSVQKCIRTTPIRRTICTVALSFLQLVPLMSSVLCAIQQARANITPSLVLDNQSHTGVSSTRTFSTWSTTASGQLLAVMPSTTNVQTVSANEWQRFSGKMSYQRIT